MAIPQCMQETPLLEYLVDVPEIPAFFLKVCEEDYSSIQFRFDTSYLQGLFSGKSIRTLFFHGFGKATKIQVG